jgi:hypothetical protein
MGQPGYYHQPPDYQTKKSLGILNGLLEQRLEILREIEGSRRLFASYGMPVSQVHPALCPEADADCQAQGIGRNEELGAFAFVG